MSVDLLTLGLDVQRSRLGMGLWSISCKCAVWCGSADIDRKDGGWRHAQVVRALDDAAWMVAYDAEVHRVWAEKPYLGYREAAFTMGYTFGYVETACLSRWPHAGFRLLQPDEWRKLAGVDLKGIPKGPRRQVLKERTMARALQLGFAPEDEHAADAALVAYAGWAREREREAA